jgi:DNA topoisomerase-6 subunit A
LPKARSTSDPVVAKLVGSAQEMHDKIVGGKKPAMKFPLRSLSNVRYTAKKGYFEMAGKKKERTLSVSTVKTFAQTMRMMALSKRLIETDDRATKRDAYYQTKNWDDARCDDQVESDTILDDIEAFFGVNKEQLCFTPDEHGGLVAGELVVIDREEPGSTRTIDIDCTKFGSGAYGVPPEVEHLGFRTKAKFILAIETGGIFDRLNRHRYWEKADCILVSMAGVPTRAVRRFVRRLADEKKIPVYVFVDCDPYGIANIYRTMKVGSGNNAHLNEFFCVPQARFLGITPQDIIDYQLPTHPLKDVDIKRARDAIKNDPFIQHHKPWVAALEKMMAMGVRVEQQAFAARGLNYVMDVYLPQKLKDEKGMLP